MLTEDVGLADEEVVADVEPGHGGDMSAYDARGHVFAKLGGRAFVFLDGVKGRALQGLALFVLAVPLEDLRVQVPAVVIKPAGQVLDLGQ